MIQTLFFRQSHMYMKIRFYQISENDFFDKVMETLPRFYPKLLSINIYAEDGVHNLPTHTEELFSKTVTFLRHVYMSNQEVKMCVMENGTETDVTLRFLDGMQEYETKELPIKTVFAHLYPLEVLSDEGAYYSFEAIKDATKPVHFFHKPLQIHALQEADYKFSYLNRSYRAFFSFKMISDHHFNYAYKSFLPEVSQEHLIRLVLISVSHQISEYETLKLLKKSDLLLLDKHELVTKKRLNFAIQKFGYTGYIAPITKELFLKKLPIR